MKHYIFLSRIMIGLALTGVLLSGCEEFQKNTNNNSTLDSKVKTEENDGAISKKESEQIALQYVKKESSHWKIKNIEEKDNYWIIRFSPTNSMPELLWLHIDKKTGGIIKVITDS